MKFAALGFLDVALIEQPGLLDEQPGIQARMLALGRDFFAFQVGNFVDARVGAHDETMIEQADRLAKVDPLVARGPADIGREMVAADKLDGTVGDVVMRVFRGDLVILIHIEAMFRP